MTLSRYIAAKKIPEPATIMLGGMRVHSWNENDIERVRKLLPKIANGRKTRYQKKRKEKNHSRGRLSHIRKTTKRAPPGVVAPNAP